MFTSETKRNTLGKEGVGSLILSARGLFLSIGNIIIKLLLSIYNVVNNLYIFGRINDNK